MKNLILAASVLVFATTSQAQADFKLFEFNLGEAGSLRNTVLESLDGAKKTTANTDLKAEEVNVDDIEFDKLFEDIKTR